MENLLEHLHITAGLSWSASILVLALVTRAAIFPFAVSAADQGTKMKEMQPVLQPLREKVAQALRDNNRQAAMETQQQIRELSKESGVSLQKAFLPILLQIPLQFGAFRLLRNAGELPVPGFETEHWLWLSSLTTGDSTYILPVLTAGLTYLNIVSSQKGQPDAMGIMKMLRGLLPAMSFVFLIFQPGCTQMYFMANGVLSQIQIGLIQNPAFRKWQNMAPLSDPTAPKPKPSASKTASSPAFSKMNIAQTAPRASGAPSPEPISDAANRSVVDKGVDLVKNETGKIWKNTIGGVGDTWREEAKKRMEKEKLEKQKSAAAKYEAQRRQDLEQERSYRNAASTDSKPLDKTSK
jgi:YidC/Oxa1 family membrane protein insertase